MSAACEGEALFAALRDAVLVVDDARGLVGANPAACRLLGGPEAALRGRRIDEFVDRSLDVDSAWTAFLRDGEQTGEVLLVCADGVRRHAEYSATARVAPSRHLAILRDVTERKRAETEHEAAHLRAQQRLRETETLLAVSRALSATLDPLETMRRVAREIARTLGADTVGAYLADPDQRSLRPVAGYHVPPGRLERFRTVPIPIANHPAIEEAWSGRRAVWTDDLAADPRVHPDMLRHFPHRSDLFVPICVKARPVGGFFVIWWEARRTFAAAEIRLLQAISDLAGIFLENAQLYREAAAASRAKDEFLATLSHELRNPLGAIANAAVALERLEAGSAAAPRLHQIIHRQADHLTHLVDDLLDIARATAGKIVLRRQPLDLGELVGVCVRALGETDRGREHRVTLRAEPAVVAADATRLAQVVSNLLENAVKFTPPGGAVDVEVRREGPEAIVSVRDTGVGIAPDVLPRVFELFAQGAHALDPAAGAGLGIGLALSRRIVELHGGSIAAASEGEGRGTQFTVRLPVAAADQPRPRPLRPDPGPPRQVVVIEDDEDGRDSLRLLLESLGHEVFVAADGPRGLALALEHHPDVVLVDLGLPGLDGYEVARRLRARREGARMRLVAVTGYGQAEDRRRSRDAGFDAHLLKPVSPAILARVIQPPGSR
jgi:PAS domain S-box-containing protein